VDGDTDTGDGEPVTDDDRDLRRAEHGGIFIVRGRLELQQRDVSGGAMSHHRPHIEAGVNGNRSHVFQLRLPVCAIFDNLVDRARLHAMRHRHHQFRRNQCAGAEIAAGADDGDDGATDALCGRYRTADDRMSGKHKQQRYTDEYRAEDLWC